MVGETVVSAVLPGAISDKAAQMAVTKEVPYFTTEHEPRRREQ